MFKDQVQVHDGLQAILRTKTGEVISSLHDERLDKPIVQVKGWVELCLRERGKIVPGSHRSGYNIWTNTGREYLALLMSYQLSSTPFRSDRIAYIGVGTGSKLEDTSVLSLAQPIAYTGSYFLAPFDIPPTFPLSPTRTTVRYSRVFAENEITTSGAQVNISEIGMFTDGSAIHVPPYTPGSRDRTLVNALLQAPMAYKTFEPVGKTGSLELEMSWEIRF